MNYSPNYEEFIMNVSSEEGLICDKHTCYEGYSPSVTSQYCLEGTYSMNKQIKRKKHWRDLREKISKNKYLIKKCYCGRKQCSYRYDTDSDVSCTSKCERKKYSHKNSATKHHHTYCCWNRHCSEKTKKLERDSQVGDSCKVIRLYPPCPPGYYRRTLSHPAMIQPFMENLKYPCPGLHKVTEIHSISETFYYCSLCVSCFNISTAVDHLSGFRHQLNCLKYFGKDHLFKRWNYKSKYQIQEKLFDELKSIQRKYGRGLIKVQKDFKEKDECDLEERSEKKVREVMKPSRETKMPVKPDTSSSQRVSVKDLADDYLRYSLPDPSKSGFYCKICDSHSNSIVMWQSHITGKRHLTNIKKAPEDVLTMNRYIPAPHERAYLMDKLREVDVPVVGLDQIREIKKKEINGVLYNCFLCCACVTNIDIVNHILSRKHREKYLEFIKHPDLKVIKSLNVKDAGMESLIEELCSKVEAENGSGEPEVFYARSAVH